MSEPQLAWNDAINGKFYENLQTALQSCQSRLSILESKFDSLQSCYEQEKCKRQTLEQAVEEVKLKLDSTFKASEGKLRKCNYLFLSLAVIQRLKLFALQYKQVLHKKIMLKLTHLPNTTVKSR